MILPRLSFADLENPRQYEYEVREGGAELVVFDVPIFAECSRVLPSTGELFVFDRPWLEAAVERARLDGAGGHWAPMHTRHHDAASDMTDACRWVGHFRPTDLGPLRIGGEDLLGVFGSLHFQELWIVEELLAGKGRWAYRSVEISDVNRPKFSSLAILDHDAPFLSLPMLTLPRPGAEVVPGGTFPGRLEFSETHRRGPVVAWFSDAPSVAVLFSEANMEDDDKPKDEESADMSEGQDSEVSAIVEKIRNGTISVGGYAEIRAAMAEQEAKLGSEEPAEETEGADETPAAAPAPSSAAMGSRTVEGSTPKDLARIDALEARLNARDQRDAFEADVNFGVDRLRGLPVGSDIRKKLEQRRKQFVNAAAFKEYVEELRSQSLVPGKGDTGRSAGTTPSPRVDKVALSYQDKGPKAVEMAARFGEDFDKLRARGALGGTKREDYIKIQMERNPIARF